MFFYAVLWWLCKSWGHQKVFLRGGAQRPGDAAQRGSRAAPARTLALTPGGGPSGKSAWRTSRAPKGRSLQGRFSAHRLATRARAYRLHALSSLPLAIRHTLRVRRAPLAGLSSERVRRAREARRRRHGSGGRCGARAAVANESRRARAAPAAAAHVRLTPRRLRERVVAASRSPPDNGEGLRPGRRANPRVFFDLEADGAPLGRVVMLLRADVVPETAKARASRRGRAPAAPHRSAFVRAFCADLPRAVYRRAARAAAVQGLGVPPRGPGLRVRGRRIVPPRGPGLRVRVERIVGRCRGAVSTVVGRNEI